MTRTEESNRRNERSGRKIGLGLTIAVHAVIFTVFTSIGLRQDFPPPPERGILIEFEEIPEEKPIEAKAGNEPKAKKADSKAGIKLVQKSEAQQTGTGSNKGEEVSMGPDGDVAKPEPPRRKPIDKRALFAAADNHKADTLAAQTADKVSNALKGGHADGNTRYGNTGGTPTARLKGRNIMGSLPYPDYTVNKSGRVVVKIMVDQYGNVKSAAPGALGTTVQDKTLWEAARKAALKARFNMSGDSPVMQEGTITYIFRLR